MSITIGQYNFEGPFPSTNVIEDRSGVYAVLCPTGGSNYTLLDVGESAGVKTRLDLHDRKNCWTKNCSGSLTYAVFYTPNLQSTGRMAIEQEIRNKYSLPCGVL